MWVERLADVWIATSSAMFAIAWSGFHKFSQGPSLMIFFSSSPASGWTHNFRLDYIELPCVSLILAIIFKQVLTLDEYNF